MKLDCVLSTIEEHSKFLGADAAALSADLDRSATEIDADEVNEVIGERVQHYKAELNSVFELASPNFSKRMEDYERATETAKAPLPAVQEEAQQAVAVPEPVAEQPAVPENEYRERDRAELGNELDAAVAERDSLDRDFDPEDYSALTKKIAKIKHALATKPPADAMETKAEILAAREFDPTTDDEAVARGRRVVTPFGEGTTAAYSSDDTPYSRSSRAKAGARSVPTRLVESVVAPLRKVWANGPRIVVLDKPKDGMPDDAKGAYENGVVYLFASNIDSKRDALVTLGHETVGHYGLRNMLGSTALDAILRKLHDQNKSIAARAAKWVRNNRGLEQYEGLPQSDLELLGTEEAIADMAGLRGIVRGINEILAKVQEFFESVGWTSVAEALGRLTDAEAMRLVARSEEFVVSGEKTQADTRGQLMYSRAETEADVSSPANFFRPLRSVREQIADNASTLANRGSKAKRSVKEMYQTMLDYLHTTRGAAAAHPTAARIYGYMDALSRAKGNILTHLDETMAAFNAAMSVKKRSTPLSRMMAGTAMRWAELPTDRVDLIAEFVKDDLSGKRPMYTHDGISGFPVLSQHVRDAGVMLTYEDFENGVRNAKEGDLVGFPDNATDEEKAALYKAYASGMDTSINAALHLLDAAKKQLEYTAQMDEADLRRKFTGKAYESIKTMRDMYKSAYERVSDIDMLKRTAEQRDENVSKRLESFEETLHGLVSNKNPLAGENSSKEVLNVIDLLGTTEKDLAELLAPLQEYVERTKEAKRPLAIREVRDAVVEGAGPAMLKESEVLRAAASILGQYVPLRREGEWVMRAELVDGNGEPVFGTIKYKDGDKTITEQTAVVLGNWHSDDLEALTDYHREHNLTAYKGEPIKVTTDEGGEVDAYMIMRRPEKVDKFKKTTDRFSAMDYLNYSKVIGVQLTPAQKSRVIKKATNADAAIRSRHLKRENIPGYSMNFQQAIADHAGGVATLSAIRAYEDKVQRLLADDGEWIWDSRRAKAHDAEIANVEQLLADAQSAAANKTYTDKLVSLRAERELVKSAPYERLPQIRENMRQMVNYVLGSDQMEEKQTGLTKLRAIATIMQLGGTLASPVINLSSLPLATFSYLATFNKKNGYGGGFGSRAASNALISAGKLLSQVLKQSMLQVDPRRPVFFAEEYFREREDKAKALGPDGEIEGYSAAHWEFLRKAAAEGVLSAQKYNELMSQRRHSQFGPKVSKAISHYMALFAATEEYNRMTTGLAAFDLYYKQFKETYGTDGEMTARDEAYEAALKAVERTQGTYNLTNRAKLLRNDAWAAIGMYKTFVITSLEQLSSMSRQGQLLYLGMLYAFAGAGGIPFWEELMIVIDVITQKTGIGLGVTRGSAESAAAEFFRAVGNELGIDKLDHYAMRGVIDTLLGTEMFGRAGISVGIPGIGLLRSGADFEEELGRSLGAFGSAVSGAYTTAGAVLSGEPYKALRNAPVTSIKNAMGAYEMAAYGGVLNKRGQKVVDDSDFTDIVARALGFYPDDFIRVNEEVGREMKIADYAKELKNNLIVQYRRYGLEGDTASQQEIMEDVDEHNATFKGTRLEILNFKKSAERAATEATDTLVGRYRDSMGKAQKQDTMLDEEDEEQ